MTKRLPRQDDADEDIEIIASRKEKRYRAVESLPPSYHRGANGVLLSQAVLETIREACFLLLTMGPDVLGDAEAEVKSMRKRLFQAQAWASMAADRRLRENENIRVFFYSESPPTLQLPGKEARTRARMLLLASKRFGEYRRRVMNHRPKLEEEFIKLYKATGLEEREAVSKAKGILGPLEHHSGVVNKLHNSLPKWEAEEIRYLRGVIREAIKLLPKNGDARVFLEKSL